jgi:hypothetical protein
MQPLGDPRAAVSRAMTFPGRDAEVLADCRVPRKPAIWLYCDLYLRAGISHFTTMFQLWTILSVGFC